MSMLDKLAAQTILVVDDIPEQANLIKALLENMYRVKVALNGIDALKIANSKTPPDLILLDIMMPGMDGFKVCQKLKKQPKTKAIPILFITGNTETAAIVKGFKLGALDYLTKLFQREELLARVKVHLSQRIYNREIAEMKDKLEQRVVERTNELAEANLKLQDDITERKQVEVERDKVEHIMGQRVKELQCLYSVSESIRSRTTMEETFQDVADLIPTGWHYPEITRGKVIFDGIEYVSEPFTETKWKQSSEITVNGEPQGAVEVYHLEKRPILDEGQFMTEERELVDAIAERLGIVAEHKQAEEGLRLHSEIVTNMTGGVYLIGAEDGIIKYANPKFEDMFGYSAGEMIGQHITLVYALKDMDAVEEVKEIIGILVETGEWQGDIENIKKDGTLFWCHANMTVFDHPEFGDVLVSVYSDITESKQTEIDLDNSHKKLRDLTAHLRSVREAEGTRIAREIHDVLGQDLTVFELDLHWLKRKVPSGQANLMNKINSMIDHIGVTSDVVDRISSELRPVMLDDLGLLAAVDWLATEFQKRSGINCKFTSEADEMVFDSTQSITIFRLIQEAFTNITRHAKANKVSVDLAIVGDEIQLSIADDGVGITQQQIADPKAFGLMGMRERIHAVDGSIDLVGKAGKGTSIAVCIPLEETH